MFHEISCPTRGCSNKILRKSGDGYWRFSGKVIKSLGDGSAVIAVCKSCNAEVELPMTLCAMGGERVSSIQGGNPGFAVLKK